MTISVKRSELINPATIIPGQTVAFRVAERERTDDYSDPGYRLLIRPQPETKISGKMKIFVSDEEMKGIAARTNLIATLGIRKDSKGRDVVASTSLRPELGVARRVSKKTTEQPKSERPAAPTSAVLKHQADPSAKVTKRSSTKLTITNMNRFIAH